MRFKLAIIVVLVLVFVVVGFQYFSGQTTETLAIDQDQFVQAYVELATLAESMPIGTPEYDREKERVLGEIGLKPQQVEDALAMYNQRPELWRPVWERIQEELEKRNGAIGVGGSDTTGSMHTP
jgi:hypothetical protein